MIRDTRNLLNFFWKRRELQLLRRRLAGGRRKRPRHGLLLYVCLLDTLPDLLPLFRRQTELSRDHEGRDGFTTRRARVRLGNARGAGCCYDRLRARPKLLSSRDGYKAEKRPNNG